MAKLIKNEKSTGISGVLRAEFFPKAQTVTVKVPAEGVLIIADASEYTMPDKADGKYINVIGSRYENQDLAGSEAFVKDALGLEDTPIRLKVSAFINKGAAQKAAVAAANVTSKSTAPKPDATMSLE